MPVSASVFGKLSGTEIKAFELTNSGTTSVKIIEYGAAIVSLRTADREGKVDDIVLGYDTLEAWLENPTYFGVVVGRCGNRIAKGKFTLDGADYQLALNNGENTLHGGPGGFHKKVWASEEVANGVKLTYTSADMEEGYPGQLTSSVTYTLNDANELSIEYSATTDKATVVNLTNHSYFNLGGATSGDIKGHEIKSPCRFYTPVNEALIPTGEIKSVVGTPFDFREQTSIGARLLEADANGYDHNYVVNRVDVPDGELAEVNTVTEPVSGRTLKTTTTEPGCQLYCGGFLDGTNIGREGKGYPQFGGFCLETQHYPDSINQPDWFPTVVLRPGGEYKSKTVYTFGVSGKRRRE